MEAWRGRELRRICSRRGEQQGVFRASRWLRHMACHCVQFASRASVPAGQGEVRVAYSELVLWHSYYNSYSVGISTFATTKLTRNQGTKHETTRVASSDYEQRYR
eukprot:scaffold303819_cov28-Prasinocladus_malaysianus.AAC.1